MRPVEPVRPQLVSTGRWDSLDPTLRVLGPLMAAGAALGTASGVGLDPGSAGWVVAAGGVQLAATAGVLIAGAHPVAFAVLIAVTGLTTTLTDPVLAQLAARGASAWLPLAIATAAQVLLRRARDRRDLALGTAALAVATAAPAAVNLAAGVPPAAAVLAAAVPLLTGALIAVTRQLSDARQDRVRRRDGSGPPRPDPAGVHPHLPVMILRLDDLADRTSDALARQAAAEVADLAREVITGGSTTGTIRVEILPRATPGAAVPPVPLPDLSDRERAILALLATGATNAAIGRDLYLSEATVKQYVSRLMRRFGDDNRTQLALRAAPWFLPP